MRKIKVCDVVRNSVWYDPRVNKQIKEYAAHGFEVHIVGEEDNRTNNEEINKLDGFPHIVNIPERYYRRQNKLNTLWRDIYIYKRLAREIIACRPEIIHANDLNALLPALIAAKKIGCKVIYDTHEIFLENNNIYKSVFLRVFWGIVEKLFIRKVDLVVCVSNAAAEYLSAKYNIETPMVVTNCVRKHDVSFCTKSIKFEVLNHGLFYAGRGYDLMIDAAKLSDNPEISYVLRGYGKMEEQLKQSVKDAALTNVRFAPPVKVYELIPSAESSHVGLAITIPYCLNFKLSVSNKLFEYAAAGLPVIMSDIPEHQFLNNKYNFGIILKDNTPESLNQAVQKLYSDKELYSVLSQNALKMSSEINWENEFSKLVEFERSIVK